MPNITIIGGGFTGTAIAIRLCQSVSARLRITVVEPRDALGGGLAYGGNDPDHRVNGTHELLVLFPDDIGHFARWYEASGRAASDPGARAETGVRYVRRSDLRGYMNDTLREVLATNVHGSSLRHLRDRAVGMHRADTGLRIAPASGTTLAADLAVLAFGGQRPAPPGRSSDAALTHPGYIGDPFDAHAIRAIAPEARILLVGMGLTAADVVASLSRNGHRGPITAISRRGLLPQPQGEPPDVAALMRRLGRPVPRFIERHGSGLTLRAAVRALRRDLDEAIAAGRDLKAPFDDARDASGWLWPKFTEDEKRRFLRHLKPWYDINRYRMVPQTGATLAALETSGQLRFRIARLDRLELRGTALAARLIARDRQASTETFDSVINCTGPKTLDADPFIDALCRNGLALRDGLGLGFDVDGEGRVMDAEGRAQDDLWCFGLLTRGRFGDMTAIPQIAFRLHRSLPALGMAALGRRGALPAGAR